MWTCGKIFSNIDYIDDDLNEDISRFNSDSSFIDAADYEGYDEYFDDLGFDNEYDYGD